MRVVRRYPPFYIHLRALHINKKPLNLTTTHFSLRHHFCRETNIIYKGCHHNKATPHSYQPNINRSPSIVMPPTTIICAPISLILFGNIIYIFCSPVSLTTNFNLISQAKFACLTVAFLPRHGSTRFVVKHYPLTTPCITSEYRYLFLIQRHPTIRTYLCRKNLAPFQIFPQQNSKT